MRVAVIGSRAYRPLKHVSSYVKTLPKGYTILSGGASGVDRTAELTAKKLGLDVEILMLEWSCMNEVTGYMRPRDLVLSADRVVVFWDKKSRGTQNSIVLARDLGKDMIVFGPDNEVLYANRQEPIRDPLH